MWGLRLDSRGPYAIYRQIGRENRMFDFVAVAIALACFAFLFVILYVLERV